MCPRCTLFLVLILSFPFAPGGASAAPFEEGNIVVSTQGFLHEYTPGGELLQSIPIPYPGGPPAEGARDATVIHPGLVSVYNGTFDPFLSTCDTETETWSHRTHPGWSTANNLSYGGIAAAGHFVFVTDQSTYGNGGTDQARGVVRFDMESAAAVRFAENIDPIDLNMGLDGLLYCLYPGGSPEGRYVDVYDPETMAFVRTIDFSAIFGHTGHRSVAVNAAGEIFVADWDGDLTKLDGAGNVLLEANLCTISTGCNLVDVDVSTEGLVVVGERFGGVTVTDEASATRRPSSPDPGMCSSASCRTA